MRDEFDDVQRVFLTMKKNSGLCHEVLICDPLTNLVAYPSFERYINKRFSHLVRSGLHLAIGDVDDLKQYTMTCNSRDPTLFGHLAGNHCMGRVGSITSQWASTMGDLNLICATFGGDELVIAASGWSYEKFVTSIRDLADRLRRCAPRPCTFAVGTATTADLKISDSSSAYRHFVSSIDRKLFAYKSRRLSQHVSPRGVVVDIGEINLLAHSLCD